MRYASMIATALALPEVDGPGRVAKWRQLVDLVAQLSDRTDRHDLDLALLAIDRLRGDVSRDQRRRAAEAVSGRAAAITVFGHEDPAIAAPVLMSVQLDEAAWLALIPQLPRASRALLRNRRDLPVKAIDMLSVYGPSDNVLPTIEASDDAGQIRALVARIEAFQTDRESAAIGADETVKSFVFETDAKGAVDWVQGVPPTALVGLLISEPAPIGGPGVDGQASGAFMQRAPFRDARLSLPGGAAGGEWLISGNPRFDPSNGRFCGYHGEARRPIASEIAQPISTIAGPSFPADALRSLIHELRTPLNAILGFAAMIEGQIIGPVGSPYRVRASQIRDDGERLLALIEELDTASRSDDPVLPVALISDLRDYLRRELDDTANAHKARGVTLVISGDEHVSIPVSAVGALARALVRVLMSLIALAKNDERLDVIIDGDVHDVEIMIPRPVTLQGLSTEALLDAGPGHDGSARNGSALGLGFAIRVLDGALRTSGGQFIIKPDSFAIVLPRNEVRDSGML